MNINGKLTEIRKRLSTPGYILQILLLGSWAFFQYQRGNEFYAIFVLFLFLSMSVFRLRNFTLIAISVLAIILFKTPIFDTWVEVRDSNLSISMLSSFRTSMSNLFALNSGKEALPVHVRRMVVLIEESKISDYRLCTTYEQEGSQRIIESAWPVRKDASSKYVLCSLDEIQNMAGCTEIKERGDVGLAYCP